MTETQKWLTYTNTLPLYSWKVAVGERVLKEKKRNDEAKPITPRQFLFSTFGVES